jgi:hypothetical protein
MQPPKDYLPKKYRTAHPRAQVASLQRIAARAASRADWVTELITTGQINDTPDQRAEIAKAWAKANGATRQMIEVARTSGCPDLEAKARVAERMLGASA